MPTKRGSRAHPSPTSRNEPPTLAHRGCWKLSTWQPPAQGFSLLAVAAQGSGLAESSSRCGSGRRFPRRAGQPLRRLLPCLALPAAVGARCWAGVRLLAALPWVPARLCVAARDAFGSVWVAHGPRVVAVGPTLREPNSKGRLQANIRTFAFILLP